MHNYSTRLPGSAVVKSGIVYDNSLSNRRRVAGKIALVVAVIAVLVCGCLTCSALSWINNLLLQIGASQ